MQLIEILIWVGVIAFALFMLGVTIAVHEFGHLLFAKWRGMVVEKFAIGFGPLVWKKNWAGIEWSVRVFPFGGFVSLPQMATMETVEGRTEQPRHNYPPAKPQDKIIAAFGGPLFSFLFGALVAMIVWIVGKPEPESAATTVVGYVLPDSPAATAETPILPGDKIIAVNNQFVSSFSATADNIIEAIILSTGQTIQFDIERPTRTGGIELITTEIAPTRDEVFNVRRVGISPASSVIVGKIAPESPAKRAGLKTGDRILEVNFSPVYSPEQFADIVNNSGGQQLTLNLVRDGQEMMLVAFPQFEQQNQRYMLGFSFEPPPSTVVHISPVDLVLRSMVMIKRTIRAVADPQSDIKAEHLSGPVGIISNQARLARQDIRLLLWFMVILNINLALLNLLPLPVLDGGHIVFSLIEWIMRRPLPTRLVESLQTVFALLLIGFMLYVTFHDSVREFKIFKRNSEAESSEKPIESLRFPEIHHTPEVPVQQPQ
jgi:regulator of sigma E protease